MSASKRKRGCNYTAEETNKLLDLVQQYQSAIDDKRTNTIYLTQKKEAWEKVSSAYNAVATSGIRTVEQLKTLYDNMKQKAKKSLAEHNKKELMRYNAEILSQHVKEEQFTTALEHEKTDKAQWVKTDGGNWCLNITPQEQEIAAIIKDQVTPLSNNCDGVSKKKNVKKRLINYKELYFKRKCQNAYLQKTKILQDIKLRQKEYLMLKKEHNLKLEILQKEYDEKFK
ncbi:myb/SANT-like DNA-binding domain-containing protein 3 [Harmonia axyridis]|uniref:myb/SANT-like DNA-binding domain-containing protein 3 n=1 Tax=Harmonia axyridis TaxID=115357 RepID=UPI001E2776E8|nr:myb/SANT-like DNA-binding domain-containing protein 3 [Harmonia axyridis]